MNNDPEQEAILKALNELPKAFLMRAMQRLGELSRAKSADTYHERCYHEHESDKEKRACDNFHIKYDKVLDYGFFE